MDVTNQTTVSPVTGYSCMDLIQEFDTRRGSVPPTNDCFHEMCDLNVEATSDPISPTLKERGETSDRQDVDASTNWNSVLKALYVSGVGWTDYKHSSYLNFIEAAFMKDLYAQKYSFLNEMLHSRSDITSTLSSNECQNQLKRKLSFLKMTERGKVKRVGCQHRFPQFVSNPPFDDVEFKRRTSAICKQCELQGQQYYKVQESCKDYNLPQLPLCNRRQDVEVHSKCKQLMERHSCSNIQLYQFPKVEQVVQSAYGERETHYCDSLKCNSAAKFTTSTIKDETVSSLTGEVIDEREPTSYVVFLKSGDKDVEGNSVNYDRDSKSQKIIQLAGKSATAMHQMLKVDAIRKTGDRNLQKLASSKWVPGPVSLASQVQRRLHKKQGNKCLPL